MPWPPTPLPINFQNATQSLDTHPTAHNTTNQQINNDLVPEINRISTLLGPGTRTIFSPTYRNAGASGGTYTPSGSSYIVSGGVVTMWGGTNITATNLGTAGRIEIGVDPAGLPAPALANWVTIGSFRYNIAATSTNKVGIVNTSNVVNTFTLHVNDAQQELNSRLEIGDDVSWCASYPIA